MLNEKIYKHDKSVWMTETVPWAVLQLPTADQKEVKANTRTHHVIETS